MCRAKYPNDPLAADLQTLPGATPSRLELLARLGLHTVGDLLFHFPRSYEDLTDLRPIAALAADVPLDCAGRSRRDGRPQSCRRPLRRQRGAQRRRHSLPRRRLVQPGLRRPPLPLRPAAVVQRQAEMAPRPLADEQPARAGPRRRRRADDAGRRAGLPADRGPALRTPPAAHRQGA